MELKFTPSNIRQIENELRKPLFDILQEISVTNQLVLIKRGMFLRTDAEAEEKMMEYLADPEHNTMTLQTEFMESLQVGGFLPRAIDIKEIKHKISDPELVAELANTSTSNGNEASQPLSN